MGSVALWFCERVWLAPSTTPLPPLLHGQPDAFNAVEASGFISKGRSPLCPPFKYLLLFCLLSAAGICTGDPLLRDWRWKVTTTSTIHRQQGPKTTDREIGEPPLGIYSHHRGHHRAQTRKLLPVWEKNSGERQGRRACPPRVGCRAPYWRYTSIVK